MKTDEVCERLLDPFAADTPPLDFFSQQRERGRFPLQKRFNL